MSFYSLSFRDKLLYCAELNTLKPSKALRYQSNLALLASFTLEEAGNFIWRWFNHKEHFNLERSAKLCQDLTKVVLEHKANLFTQDYFSLGLLCNYIERQGMPSLAKPKFLWGLYSSILFDLLEETSLGLTCGNLAFYTLNAKKAKDDYFTCPVSAFRNEVPFSQGRFSKIERDHIKQVIEPQGLILATSLYEYSFSSAIAKSYLTKAKPEQLIKSKGIALASILKNRH